MNILDYIDYLVEEVGMTDEEASRLADLEFNNGYSQED